MLAVDMGDRDELEFTRWVDEYKMRGSTGMVNVIGSSEQEGCCTIA
jgi:hypothetical protein